MGANLTSFDAVLKNHYVDKIPEILNQKIKLREYFRKVTDMKVDGRAVVYPVHIGRNTGVGAVGEDATLPTAGNQQYVDLSVPFRYNYGRIQMTAQAMKQSLTNKGAFRKVVDEEIKRAAQDVARDMNRQLFGFGRGDLCHVDGAVSSATTVNLKNPGGVIGTDSPARYLRVGDIIAVVKSDGTFEAVATISSIASDLKSIVVGSSISCSDGSIIVRASHTSASTVNDTAWNKEVMGMLGHIDDGTYTSSYHGITRASYPVFKSYRLSAGGSLTLKMIQKAFDAADQLGNGSIKVMFAHHSVRREYLNLLQSMRRYNDEKSMTPDGGFKGAALENDIVYAGIDLKAERDCPYGTIFGIDDSGFNRYVVADGDWAEDDGRVLMRVQNKDAYEARFRVFDNYCNDTPNTCFTISGITTSESPEAIQSV